MGGLTVRTRTLEDGRVEASSPNYPALLPVTAENARMARAGYERRLLAYGATGCDVDKANKADVSGTSRDRRTCG